MRGVLDMMGARKGEDGGVGVRAGGFVERQIVSSYRTSVWRGAEYDRSSPRAAEHIDARAIQQGR